MKPAGAVRIGIVVAACFSAVSAFAQAADTSGMPGLIGRARNQDLEVTLSAASAYDDNLVAVVNDTVPNPETQVGGAYEGFAARVRYLKKFRYASLDLGENSVARLYPSLTESSVLQHSAAASLTTQKNKTTMTLAQTVVLSPFYSYTTPPTLGDASLADAPSKAVDQSLLLHRSDTYTSTALVSQGLGRHLTVALSGIFQDAKFEGEATDLRTDGGSARLTYRLPGGLGLVAGYGYQEGIYTVNTVPSTVRLSTINLGLDFNRALTTSRNTTFAVHTGTVGVKGSDGSSVYQLVGDARLTHQFSRAWRGLASYTRGVGLVNGIQGPTLSSSLATSLDGRLSRRIGVSMQGSYSRDQIGIVTAANFGHTYAGSGTMHFTLSRLTSLSASYVFYSYRFDRDTSLPDGVPPQFHRQELRLGVDLWLPLVR